MHIISSAHLKSSLPLESTLWFELVPIKQVWFSNHLFSVRPGSKRFRYSSLKWKQKVQRFVKLICVKGVTPREIERGKEGGRIASCMLRDTAKLPACVHIFGLSYPTYLPHTGQGGCGLPTLLLRTISQAFTKMPFPSSSHHPTLQAMSQCKFLW